MATLIELAKTRPIGLADALEEAATGILSSLAIYRAMLGEGRKAEAEVIESIRRDVLELRGGIRALVESPSSFPADGRKVPS